MFGSGRVAFPNVQEWSRDPSECSSVVGRPTLMFGSGGRPSGCPGVVGRPSRMSGSAREALLDVGSGREVLSNVRELLEGPPGYP